MGWWIKRLEKATRPLPSMYNNVSFRSHRKLLSTKIWESAFETCVLGHPVKAKGTETTYIRRIASRDPELSHPSSLDSDSCCHTSTLENTRYLGILPDTYSASIYGLVYPDGERITSSDYSQ